MQFTPQQLVGAGRYAPVTRIGNWNEDLMLEEARMAEFQLRKTQGSLLATYKLKSDFLHQRVPRSFHGEHHEQKQPVMCGDAVALGHLDSDALLACNVFEETPSIGSGEFLVTVAPRASSSTAGKASQSSSSPIARNTFRVVSPTAWKQTLARGHSFRFDQTEEGDGHEPLRYGEPFLLMCNESLLVDDQSVLMKAPLFLKSGIKSDRSMSPITYNQRVWLGTEADSASLWVCQRADLAGTEKFLSEGECVHAGDYIAVVHKMTGQPLATEATNKQPTDFGVEQEVCALLSKSSGKHFNLAAEVMGTRTADTEGRMQLACNTWTFVLASSEAEARDPRVAMPEMASASAVVHVLQRCLMPVSLYAFRGFLVALRRLDTAGTGHVQRDDVKWFMKPYKFPLRDEHLDLLFDVFDRRNTGFFPVQELLRVARVPVSQSRVALIEAAFSRLSENGPLTLCALVERYDASIDSRVRSNQLSTEAAVAEYRGLWTNAQETVSHREFVEVYSDIAMVVAQDEHFAQLLAESWR